MSILCIGLFIKDHGVLPKSRSCGQCDKTFNTVHCNSKGYHYFFCNSCKKKYSLRNGTILSLANISFRKIVFLVYFFITSFLSYKQVRKEVSISSSEDDCDESNGDEEDDDSAKRCIMSNKTISRYYSIFR